ncbi:hypothetical protein FB451DRAFT_1167940 [Mycena latifolia]|nr:hypothetical protein FB451DRAFT_1167940 [Mycena latifolia]
MLSCSKLIGFITFALVMGGAVHAQLPVPLSLIAYTDDNGGGALITYDNLLTGVCFKITVTAHSITPAPVLLNAYLYRSGDCSRIAIDRQLPEDIRYGKVTNTNLDPVVPLSFIAYTNNDGGGAQTTYNEVVTGVCYKMSATARSIMTVPVPLSAATWRSDDCTHVVGDSDGGFSDVTYDQATNTRRDARSILFAKRAPESDGDPGDE